MSSYPDLTAALNNALAAADRLSEEVDVLLEAIRPSLDRTPLRTRPTDAVQRVLSAQIAYERARR